MNRTKKIAVLAMAFVLLFISACSNTTASAAGTSNETNKSMESNSQQDETSRKSEGSIRVRTNIQGEEVLEILEQYVESGVLTQEEAEELAEFLEENKADKDTLSNGQGKIPQEAEGNNQEKPQGKQERSTAGEQGNTEGGLPEGIHGDGQGRTDKDMPENDSSDMNGGGKLLKEAVEEGIITQEQADQIQDVLKELHSQGPRYGTNQQSCNQ